MRAAPNSPGSPGSPGSPAPVLAALVQMCQGPGHEFWPDDPSLRDASRFDPDRLLDSAQITDSYLLAMAAARGGRLATFDRRLVVDAVRGGRQALELRQGWGLGAHDRRVFLPRCRSCHGVSCHVPWCAMGSCLLPLPARKARRWRLPQSSNATDACAVRMRVP